MGNVPPGAVGAAFCCVAPGLTALSSSVGAALLPPRVAMIERLKEVIMNTAAARNRVIHEYGNVDFEIVWETIQDHLPLALASASFSLLWSAAGI